MAEEKKVNVEIEEMLNALGDPTPENLKDEEEEKEEEKHEEKKEEEETPPKKKEGEEGEETPPEEKKEEEGEEEKEEEETDKDKIIESLRKRLNEKPEEEVPKKEEEKVEKKEPEEKVEPFKIEDQDFIGDLDLDDLTRDKIAFNKILNFVYSKGVNDSKRMTTEDILNTIPEIVKHNLTLLTTLKEASDNFYEDNKDLVPFKRVVAAVFEDIASKNPDKKYSELMNLVAPEARKRLELHKQTGKEGKGKEKEEENGNPPRLHGVKGGQRQTPSRKPNTSALADEIAAMNKVIGR